KRGGSGVRDTSTNCLWNSPFRPLTQPTTYTPGWSGWQGVLNGSPPRLPSTRKLTSFVRDSRFVKPFKALGFCGRLMTSYESSLAYRIGARLLTRNSALVSNLQSAIYTCKIPGGGGAPPSLAGNNC